MQTKTTKSSTKASPKMVGKQKTTVSLYEKLNSFFDKRPKPIFWILMATGVVFSFLLFDAKINMMGDDADYIIAADNLVENFSFPSGKGPLYPFLLSPFVAIFGNNIIVFKLLSAILIFLSVFFFYKALYKRVPNIILFSTLTLLAVNAYFLAFTNQVLSEPLFIFMQSLLLFYFVKYFGCEQAGEISFAKLCKRFLIISCLILLLTLSRTVGYAAIGVVMLYFLFTRKWKYAFYSVFSSGIVFGLYTLLKKLIWPVSGESYNLSGYFTKDPYSATKGMEDFSGLITRFLENTNNYISKFVAMFLGIRPVNTITPSWTISILVIALAALAFYWALKRNKSILFLSLYVALFCAANFIILHALWQQDRMVLAYAPFILLVLLSGIYFTFEGKRKLQFLYPTVIILLFCSTLFGHTIPKIEKNLPVLKGNLRGNEFAGLTPDWQSYLEVTRWAGKNIPDSLGIGARKPNTSRVYGNRNFIGIYAVPGVDKDTIKVLMPASSKIFLAVDVSKVKFDMLAPYTQYMFIGPLTINNASANSIALYEVNQDTLHIAIQALSQHNINYTLQVESLFSDVADDEKVVAYSPDELFENLKRQNIHYMIMASLRLNPAMYTGDIINTLQRYLYIVSFKYPHIIKRECYSSGSQEPAALLELNV